MHEHAGEFDSGRGPLEARGHFVTLCKRWRLESSFRTFWQQCALTESRGDIK